jgi:hypothetical protein
LGRKKIPCLNNTNGKIDAYVDYSRPSLAIEILSAKKRGVRLRYITEITNENISYCRQLLTMVDELRQTSYSQFGKICEEGSIILFS